MNKRITLFFLIVITPLLQSAAFEDKPLSSEVRVAGVHTLISKENNKITIPAQAALTYCGLLKRLDAFAQEACSEKGFEVAGTVTDLSSFDLSSKALQLLADLIQAAHILEHTTSIVSSKRIAESLTESYSHDAVTELLGAIEMLQLHSLIADAVAHIAVTPYNEASLKDFANFPSDARSAIAKQLFLRLPASKIPTEWQNDQNDIAFCLSIQDLIDHNRLPQMIGDNILFLRFWRINDLTGFSRIPGINELDVLLLDNNRIESIDPGIFSGLAKVRFLDLYSNPITENPAERLRIEKEVKAASPIVSIKFI